MNIKENIYALIGRIEANLTISQQWFALEAGNMIDHFYSLLILSFLNFIL